MEEQSVWKALTRQPDLVMTEHAQAYQEWTARAEAYRVELFGTREGWAVMVRGLSPSETFVGWTELPQDPGWRMDAREGCAVPRLTTSAGKTAAARMMDLQPPPDPRTRFDGMPSFLVHGLHTCSPSVEQLAGKLYVRWPLPAAALADVDDGMWAPVPLSKYWALREREDARRAAAETPPAPTRSTRSRSPRRARQPG